MRVAFWCENMKRGHCGIRGSPAPTPPNLELFVLHFEFAHTLAHGLCLLLGHACLGECSVELLTTCRGSAAELGQRALRVGSLRAR